VKDRQKVITEGHHRAAFKKMGELMGKTYEYPHNELKAKSPSKVQIGEDSEGEEYRIQTMTGLSGNSVGMGPEIPKL
jgi:hypothetical protein